MGRESLPRDLTRLRSGRRFYADHWLRGPGPRGIVLLSGTSGPVAWEVIDVDQTGDPEQEIRWSYTLVLRGTGTTVQFQTLQTGSEGSTVTGAADTQPFAERLEAQGRLLIDGSYAIRWGTSGGPTFGHQVPGGPDGVRVFYRLSGKDAGGGPVRVDVRFLLHPGIGTRRTEPRPAPASAGPSAGGPAPIVPRDGPPSGTEPFAHERLGVKATAIEEALLEDLQDGRLDRHSELDAALIVSGARNQRELDALRRRFVDATASASKRVAGLSTPGERAATLLAALHPSRTTEAPLLREYAMDATTLIDVIETGRYNCVSATIVFLLLRTGSRLDAGAVLLPSHARAVVRIGGKRVAVETTAPYGFDPSAAELREIQRRFRADVDRVPSYVDEVATEVDFLALLGAVYTNVATFRTDRGDANTALAIARRADVFVAPTDRLVLNRVRIGLLNEMAVASTKLGRHEEAVRALQEATRLVAEDDTRAFLNDSLTAVALGWLHEIAPSAEDATVLAFSDRFSEGSPVKDEVRSFALRLLAHRRGEQAQWGQALADLRQAAVLTRMTEHRDQIARELAHVELRYVDDLAVRDIERAWQVFQALPRGGDDDELNSLRRLVSHRLVAARLWHLAEHQQCEQLDQSLSLWRDFGLDGDPDRIRASCHGGRGVALWERGDLDRATDDFRRAYRLAPDEPVMERNLVGALQGLIAGHIRGGRCQDARPLIEEGLSLAPEDSWLQWAATTCRSGQ